MKVINMNILWKKSEMKKIYQLKTSHLNHSSRSHTHTHSDVGYFRNDDIYEDDGVIMEM